jgi:hypothetical protein
MCLCVAVPCVGCGAWGWLSGFAGQGVVVRHGPGKWVADEAWAHPRRLAVRQVTLVASTPVEARRGMGAAVAFGILANAVKSIVTVV